MKRKKLLQALCFLLLLCLALTGLGLLLRERSGSASSFYALPEDSVSALFIGGSHVNATYIPAELWTGYGIASHNLFSPNQPLWTSYHYLIEALKTQSPDIVVLELFGLTYGHSYAVPAAIDSDNAEAGFHIKFSANFLGMAAASSVFGVESPPFFEYLNLVRYHYRWKELDSSFLSGMTAESDMARGYELLSVTESFEDDDFSESAEAFEPYIGARLYLEAIRRLCERENIPLVLAISPYAPNETERGIFAWARQYAEKHSLPLLNYNGADGERIGLDRSADLADIGHTNYRGALKVTRDMGEYLSANYTLRSRDEVPDASQRDADAADFADKAKISMDISAADPADFFSLVASDASYTLIAAGSFTSEQLAALEPLGLKAEPGEPLAAVSTGGEITGLAAGEGAALAQQYGAYSISAGAEKPQITINGETYEPRGGEAVFLLFKNDFGWPLDLSWYEGGQLAHREFTSSDLEALTAN
ncbi:MAG: hypothetical protein Q4B42_00410 [Oscillospiraceae bacterium]|nr:hypothetical protein [Oscillospiraceae bacterium]